MESQDPVYAKIVEYLDQVRCDLSAEDYGRAYAFLLLILKVKPGMRFSIEDEFKKAWTGWSLKLVSLLRVDDLISLYEQGCEAFPECEDLHLTMGGRLYAIGQKLSAYSTYRRVLHINPDNMVACECTDNLCRSIIDNWHFPMLNDVQRNSKFFHAIQDHISAAHHHEQEVEVLDIGSGTGILSLFAAQAGSKSVLACESCPTLSHIAKEVIQGSGMEGIVTTCNGRSTFLKIDGQSEVAENSVALPRRVSLVLSELVDAGGFGEGIVETLDHAWKELLLPPSKGGTVIPAKIKMKAFCIESETIHRRHCASPATENSLLIISNVGINLQNSGTTMSNKLVNMCETEEPYTSEKLSEVEHRTLSACHVIQEVDFNNPALLSKMMAFGGASMEVKISVTKSGFFDAAVLCFELALDKGDFPKYTLDTFIGNKNCWEQAVYPIRNVTCQGKVNFSRIAVNEGDSMTLLFLQYHDKIILQNCKVESNKFSEEVSEVPQYSEFLARIPKESSVFVFNEEIVASMNNYHFWHPFENAFAVWHKDCFETLEKFTSREIVGGDDAKKSTDGKSEHEPLLVADMLESLSVIMLQLASDFGDVKFYKIVRDEQSKMLRCGDILGLKNYTNRMCQHSAAKYDAIFIDMVERNGMFQQEAFLNLIWAKSRLRPGGVIFPAKVKVMAMIIESEELVKRCSIPSTDDTMGFSIGPYLKPLQARTLSHINMKTTNFKALSQPFVCCEVDTNNVNRSEIHESAVKVKVQICDGGTVHGVILWHVLEVYHDISCDTSDPGNDCLQCVAMVTKDAMQVTYSDNVCVSVRRRLSYVAVEVCKDQDSF